MSKSISSENFWGFVLLAALIFAIFLLPVLPIDWQSQGSRIVYTILYFSAIFSLDKKIKSILALSVVAFCMNWIAGLFSIWILTPIAKFLSIIFFIIIVVILIKQVATAPEVNLKVILGSVIGYLLIGFMYSIFIAFIMEQDPAAFNTTRSPDDSTSIEHLGESIYFSFVTLATLGYGDILPMKPYARSVAMWITISGQLYIGIIIALLVGKFASRYTHEKPN